MSKRKRRKFTTEQKADAARLVREVGSIAQVARDLDLTDSALRQWVKQATIDEGNGSEDALTTEEKKELRRLRREVHTLKQGRDLQKSRDLHRQGTRSAFELIEAEKGNFSALLHL